MEKLGARRNLLAELFIVLLAGLAYQEMINPVKESIQAQGFSTEILALFAMFFLGSLRFFIGAQLHLVNAPLLKQRSGAWFFDFMFITFEFVLFIFLGGVTSTQQNSLASLDFLEILMIIYIVDIVWVLLQLLTSKLFADWSRTEIPWQWAFINAATLLLMGGVYATNTDVFSPSALVWFASINLIAFMVDVFVFDVVDVI